MIATLSKQELASALAAPCRTASSSLLAYLACVRIDAADALTIDATDLTESVRSSAAALVEEPGRALLPANRLASIVKTLPDAAVTIEAKGSRADIACGSTRFTLPTLDADDIPAFPKPEDGRAVSMPFEAFADAARRSALAASKDNNRPILTGVLVEAAGGNVRMVATDSYRIACVDTPVEDAGAFSAVIPVGFLLAAASLKESGDVMLSASDNQIRIECGATALVTRTIEGTYPAWERLFPDKSDNVATIGRALLAGAVQRAMVAGNSKQPMAMRFEGGSALFECDGGEDGSLSEGAECVADGVGIAKASCKYLADALASIDSDEVEVRLNRPTDPVVIVGGSAKTLVMPVR